MIKALTGRRGAASGLARLVLCVALVGSVAPVAAALGAPDPLLDQVRMSGFATEMELQLLEILAAAEQNAAAAREAKEACDEGRYGFFLFHLRRGADALQRESDRTLRFAPASDRSREEIEREIAALDRRITESLPPGAPGDEDAVRVRSIELSESARKDAARVRELKDLARTVGRLEDLEPKFEEGLAQVQQLISDLENTPAPCGGARIAAQAEPDEAATFKGDIATIDQSGRPTDGTVVEIPGDPEEEITQLDDEAPIDPQKRYIVDAACHERVVAAGFELAERRRIELAQEERRFRIYGCEDEAQALEETRTKLEALGFRPDDFDVSVRTGVEEHEGLPHPPEPYCEVLLTAKRQDGTAPGLGCPGDPVRVTDNQPAGDPTGGAPDGPGVDPGHDDPSVDPPHVPPVDPGRPVVDPNNKRKAALTPGA